MRPRFALLMTWVVTSCASPASRVALSEVEACYQRGVAKVDARDEASAIDDFSRVIALDPRHSMAFNERGHCFNVLGHYQDALADYDRAIDLEPNYAWSHYARGMTHHNLGRYELAIAGYTRAIELVPTFVKAWQWRGFTRKLLAQYAGALEDLSRALELDPDDRETRLELAKVHQASGDLASCEVELEGLLSRDPHDAHVLAQLGFAAAVQRRTTDALARFGAASRSAEDANVSIWMLALRTLESPGDDRARDDFRVWSQNARLFETWNLRLVAFMLGEGDDERIVAWADEETASRIAQRKPPDFLACEARFYAGLRHEIAGDLAPAREQYRAAREQSAPESWEWHFAAVRLQALR